MHPELHSVPVSFDIHDERRPFGRPGFGFGRRPFGFGRPGFGFGFGGPFFGGFLGGLAAGALLTAPYGYE
ncbi:hypothetical protein [Peribacillus asahii]|uniref:hypothetical protein n=1 Tax=Peribacillus asahii TaxID=228899 RepID=UPI00207B07C3|nr:hypothetical protein [Peribacillus asahii]USK68686.1 hypothetical protein LIS76_13880 [Peribacillus asahii]